jgi:hypothetical protein
MSSQPWDKAVRELGLVRQSPPMFLANALFGTALIPSYGGSNPHPAAKSNQQFTGALGRSSEEFSTIHGFNVGRRAAIAAAEQIGCRILEFVCCDADREMLLNC